MSPTRSILVLPSADEGLEGAIADLGAELLRQEIGARIPDGQVETLSPADPWDAPQADRAAGRGAGLVVAWGGPPSAGARQIIDDLSVRDLYVEIAPVGQGLDPLLLAERLYHPTDLENRRQFLRMTGVLPASGSYVATYYRRVPAGTDVAVDSLAFRAGSRAVSIPDASTALDLVAIAGGAATVVSDQLSIVILAAGLGQPAVLVGGSPADAVMTDLQGAGVVVVGTPDDVRALGDELPAVAAKEWVSGQISEADRALDALAGRLRLIDSRIEPRPDADVVADLRERVKTLERITESLRRRLHEERAAWVRYVQARTPPARPSTVNKPVVPDRALEEAEAEVERLQAELDRLHATRIMRAARPARTVYAKVRSRRR